MFSCRSYPAPAPPRAKLHRSVTSDGAAQRFREHLIQKHLIPGVSFHSFMESDDKMFARFCNYMLREQREFDPSKVAVISEDETAYGSQDIAKGACFQKAVQLFYPRNISALRGAYQTTSLFDTATPTQPTDTQKRNLPTDFADPAGRVHDSIRNYGANETPLSQEALLMNMVAALHEFHVQYILLRGSNSLDQLFLANFFRRS
jgi:hypothetical protein